MERCAGLPTEAGSIRIARGAPLRAGSGVGRHRAQGGRIGAARHVCRGASIARAGRGRQSRERRLPGPGLHELRTPLNAIVRFGCASWRPHPTRMPRRYAKATAFLKRSVDQQRRLIGNLLDTARIASGKLPLRGPSPQSRGRGRGGAGGGALGCKSTMGVQIYTLIDAHAEPSRVTPGAYSKSSGICSPMPSSSRPAAAVSNCTSSAWTRIQNVRERHGRGDRPRASPSSSSASASPTPRAGAAMGDWAWDWPWCASSSRCMGGASA